MSKYIEPSIFYDHKHFNPKIKDCYSFTLTINKYLYNSYVKNQKQLDVQNMADYFHSRVAKLLRLLSDNYTYLPEIYEEGEHCRMHFHGIIYLKKRITPYKLQTYRDNIEYVLGFNKFDLLRTNIDRIKWLAYMYKHKNYPETPKIYNYIKPDNKKDNSKLPNHSNILDYFK